MWPAPDERSKRERGQLRITAQALLYFTITLAVLMLSKQELIPGPMNVSAYINQDQNISKDLTLWNQQGSQVLQGQTLVLPMGETFLYVSPIYLQATQARMPQLKKVVLAVGNQLVYSDTYEQALALLSGSEIPQTAQVAQNQNVQSTAPAQTSAIAQQRLERVRTHLQRYKQLAGEGRWAEAGKELDAIESELK